MAISIPTLNFSETAEMLTFYLQGSNLQQIPALVGLTGIGKTAAVNMVVKRLNRELIYFNIAQMQEGELALPFADNGSVRYHLNHKLQYALDNPDKQFIVFVDEFTRGTIPVISEWMTIFNERQLQGYTIPENVRFVVAMNPSQSMRGYADTEYAASEMDDAHANRFTFIDVHSDKMDWLEWGKQENPDTKRPNIHRLVTAFLDEERHTSHFYSNEEAGIRKRTPRSWDYLSQNLYDLEDQNLMSNTMMLNRVVQHNLGTDGVSTLFMKYIQNLLSALSPKDVFKNVPLTDAQIKEFERYPVNKQIVVFDAVCQEFIAKTTDDVNSVSEIMVDNTVALWKILSVSAVDAAWNFAREIGRLGMKHHHAKPKVVTADGSESPAYVFSWKPEVLDFVSTHVTSVESK